MGHSRLDTSQPHWRLLEEGHDLPGGTGVRSARHIAVCEDDPAGTAGALSVLDMEALSFAQPHTAGDGGHSLRYLGVPLERYRDCGALADQRDAAIPRSLRECYPAAEA